MNVELFRLWVFLAESPLLWLTVTIAAYLLALWVYRRFGMNPLLNPVLVSVSILIVLLLATKTPYPTYFEGAKFVHFLIGPATVALAIPLYAQLGKLKTMWRSIGFALLVGSLTAIVSAIGLVWWAGGSKPMMIALAAKSATLPIAMGVTERVGGEPSLTAVAVALTGISGAIIARTLLNLFRFDNPAVRGFALGITAHAIGTARALQVNPTAGAFSALAMGLNGVATALLVPLVLKLLQLTP